MGLAKEVVTTQAYEKLCSDLLYSHESVRFVGLVNNKSDLLYLSLIHISEPTRPY